ncbi:LysR family transcriptional regulator [Dactylosporangium aurantiacum]|uniref:LysR family transcriptional regulator n=1 Tax=Dactylosporangium aurantiacum TaxID=35754 RepID=A0A9Q9IBS3_9ACTN|nr:LysR family transcriptional regulator [Dactylosporangium aurantiacum]MDG6101961.1 LysR family transcriptional regulator [Dactylosporangium aurantiacum]UWZ52251.1 LysR family transcriptional regulator [Dactylosporangium aurantiacum]
MLDLTRLRVLLAVARHGSVTAAAEALHYAQPSVSHHLARLEAETGARLVQRVGRGVRLTPAGRLLAERAEEILGRLDAAEAELAEHSGLAAGRVRLAAFPSALGSFVPPAAARFAAAHPAVALSLVEAEPPEALRLLKAGEVDVAVVFDYAPPAPGDGFRLTPLFDEPLHLVTGAADTRDLAGLAGERWIGGCDRCRSSLVQRCEAAGFAPQIAFTTDDYVAVQALVAAGLGVTILPDLALRAHRAAGVRAVPLPGPGRHVSAALYGAPPDPPGPAALLEALLAA